jgi:hypothetical protein
MQNNKLSSISSDDLLGIGNERQMLMLTRPEDEEYIYIKYIETNGYWLVDNLNSRIIEFGGCLYDEQLMHRNRMYFRTDFLDGNEIKKMPEDFIKWGAAVFRFVKKMLVYDKNKGLYFGQGALEWQKRTNGKFVM